MENRNNRCFMCRELQRYYTLGVKQFNVTKYGRCCIKRENVSVQGTCEAFSRRKPKEKYSYRRLKNYLNRLLSEIHAIRKAIEEDYDNENVQDL